MLTKDPSVYTTKLLDRQSAKLDRIEERMHRLNASRPAKRVRLWERVAASPSRVDRAAGIIRGVKIIGFESKNGRRYPRETLARAVALYEGIRVNLDHKAKLSDRAVTERFGELRGVRVGTGGLYGDLHYLKKHPLAEMVCEAAERMPRTLGLSHVAEGRTRREGGTTIVEEIEMVHSVDLVSDPATTGGLFESRRVREQADPLVVDNRTDAATAGMSADDDGTLSIDPERQLRQSFRVKAMLVWDDQSMTISAKLKKLEELMQAEADAVASVEDDDDTGMASESLPQTRAEFVERYTDAGSYARFQKRYGLDSCPITADDDLPKTREEFVKRYRVY